jgi:hypothetical protein
MGVAVWSRLVSCTVAVLSVASACGGTSAGPTTPTPAPPAPTVSAPFAPEAPPEPAESSPFAVSPEGELTTPGEVSFRVRPLSGPGSMGPSELAPESEVALSHVKKYLEAHPDQPLRVECSVNVSKLSSGPNSGYAANLANLVARWLVEHGVPCQRVEAVGRLERAPEAPAEKVRFLVRWGSEAPDARAEPCSAHGRLSS